MSTLKKLCLVPLGVLVGCGGGGSSEPSNPAVADETSGTYVGKLQTTGRENAIEEVHLTFKKAASAVTGSLYYVDSAQSLTLTGTAGANSIAFQGSASGSCAIQVSGSIATSNGKPTGVSFTGTNCDGPISAAATIAQTSCVDMSGRYVGTEKTTLQCTQSGQTDSQDISGSAEADLTQDASCRVSYLPPGASAGATRTGSIEGKAIRFSGPLILPSSGVTVSQNSVNLEGDIINEWLFTLSGSGAAAGSVNSVPFSCSANGTATFRRCYDLAVPILRGGPFTDPASLTEPQNVALHTVRDTLVKDRRITAKVFDANPVPFVNQIANVQRWLNDLNTGCKKLPVPAMIIGHSLGADGASRVNYPRVCSRTLLDFWDSTLKDSLGAPVYNQRSSTARALVGLGTVLHYQAQSPDNSALHLLGRTIVPTTGLTQSMAANTNHQSIAGWYADQPALYQSEAARCMR